MKRIWIIAALAVLALPAAGQGLEQLLPWLRQQEQQRQRGQQERDGAVAEALGLRNRFEWEYDADFL